MFDYLVNAMNKKKLTIITVSIAILGILCAFAFANKSKDNELPQEEIFTEDTVVDDSIISDPTDIIEDVTVDENPEDNNTTNKNNETDSSNTTDSITSDSNSGSSNSNDNSSANTSKPSTNSNSSSTSKKSNGVFQGFADDSFVELKVGDSYNTYKVSSEAKEILSSKNIGDSIEFQYIQENGQTIITIAK